MASKDNIISILTQWRLQYEEYGWLASFYSLSVITKVYMILTFIDFFLIISLLDDTLIT